MREHIEWVATQNALGEWCVASVDKKGKITIFAIPSPYGHSEQIDEANARLMAAAPELLESCKAALDHVHELEEAWHTGALSEHDGKGGTRSNRNIDVRQALRDAITKATTQEAEQA